MSIRLDGWTNRISAMAFTPMSTGIVLPPRALPLQFDTPCPLWLLRKRADHHNRQQQVPHPLRLVRSVLAQARHAWRLAKRLRSWRMDVAPARSLTNQGGGSSAAFRRAAL